MTSTAKATAEEVAAREAEWVLPLDPGGALEVATHRGTVDLVPWERAEVQVAARIEAPPGLEARYAREIVAATQVRVGGGGGAVYVHTDHGEVPPAGRRRRWLVAREQAPRLPAVAYRIQAPRRLDVRVLDHASELRVGAFEGAVEVVTHAGAVIVEDLVGELRVVSHKGPTTISGFAGRLHLESHAGKLVARRVRLTAPSRVDTYRGEVDFEPAAGAGLTLMARLGERAVASGALAPGGGRAAGGVRVVDVGGGGPVLWMVSAKGRVHVGLP